MNVKAPVAQRKAHENKRREKMYFKSRAKKIAAAAAATTTEQHTDRIKEKYGKEKTKQQNENKIEVLLRTLAEK